MKRERLAKKLGEESRRTSITSGCVVLSCVMIAMLHCIAMYYIIVLYEIVKVLLCWATPPSKSRPIRKVRIGQLGGLA